MVGDILRGQSSGIDQPLHERVIDGQLLKFSGTQPVSAGVTDVTPVRGQVRGLRCQAGGSRMEARVPFGVARRMSTDPALACASSATM